MTELKTKITSGFFFSEQKINISATRSCSIIAFRTRGGGFFFDLPQNRGADRQQNVFHCIAANFYPFLTLVPYFFRNFLNFLKMKNFSNFNGLKCKFQQHFLKGKSKNKPKSNFEFFGGKKTKFYFFFAHFQKVRKIPENLGYKHQKRIKTRFSGLI